MIYHWTIIVIAKTHFATISILLLIYPLFSFSLSPRLFGILADSHAVLVSSGIHPLACSLLYICVLHFSFVVCARKRWISLKQQVPLRPRSLLCLAVKHCVGRQAHSLTNSPTRFWNATLHVCARARAPRGPMSAWLSLSLYVSAVSSRAFPLTPFVVSLSVCW